MRVLLAEDDARLGGALNKALASRGFDVHWLDDGSAARDAALHGGFDLVLLDLNLPGCTGFDILAAIRRRNTILPVLVLTARSDVRERVRVLDGGADDYLVKPFDLDELCARMRALHRRGGGGDDVISIRGLVLDPGRHEVTRDGQPVALPPKEFALLRVLLENAGRVCDRGRLEEALYGWDDDVTSNAVEVHIHHLRRKVGAEVIHTIRGVGYMVERDT